MDKVNSKLTVYFDGMYWAGLFERIEDNKLTVSKTIFGSEPSDAEVYEFILKYGNKLQYSPAVDAVVREVRKNPKRMQREARKAMSAKAVGTKAQQALKLQHEQQKKERQDKARNRKRAEEERKFELKQRKKKEKHKGH